MTQERELFCNYQQSALLKRLGFDWECAYIYHDTLSGECKRTSSRQPGNHNAGIYTSAPSVAMAENWIREVCGLAIVVKPEVYNHELGYSYYLFSLHLVGITGWSQTMFPTFEEAHEAALTEALEQIDANNYKFKKNNDYENSKTDRLGHL